MESIRILLVDDENDFRRTVVKRLTKRGLDTKQAASGEECLGILKKDPVDVVVLDVKMPGMDGIETLHHIKKNHPKTEVIMLTGHGSAETAVKGMKLGAFDYLMKPAEFEELTSKLQRARKRKDDQEERIRKAESKLLVRKSGGAF